MIIPYGTGPVHCAKDTDVWWGNNKESRALPGDSWEQGLQGRACGCCLSHSKPSTVSKTLVHKVSTHQEPDHLFLKTGYYSSLLLENTHAAAHRPRSQTDRRKGREKAGEKRQQYIKCFFFNETNLKDVQSGSRCAVHKHGKNKQTEGQSSNRSS